MITRRLAFVLAVVALFVVTPLYDTDYWCSLAKVGFPAFVIGIGLGRLSEARKGQLMAYSHRLREWFDHNVAVLYMVVAVLALGGIIVAASATLTNARQDDDQDRLLGCFDRYAAASSASSTKVRAATVEVDEKGILRDQALDAIFQYLATDPPEGDARGTRLFLELLAANADLVDAQAALDQVRKDNPVPKPPRSFCAD